MLLAIGLSIGACAWGGILYAALPRGLGQWLLHSIWRPTYPLVLPLTAAVIGACVTAGAIAGLRALGVARRSLRAEVITSALYIVFTLAGAARWGAIGAVGGGAVATLIGAVIWWFQLHLALRESGVAQLALTGHQPGKHRLPPGTKASQKASQQASQQSRPESRPNRQNQSPPARCSAPAARPPACEPNSIKGESCDQGTPPDHRTSLL